MPTRRDILLGALAAGVTLHTRAAFAKASQPATAVNFEVPAGACDCHTHIHAPQFPFFEGRVYTPEPAMPDEMAALHKALRMQRVVIVQPSVYGTDNSATLFGMKARGRDARGVAVIDDKTPDSELSFRRASPSCRYRRRSAGRSPRAACAAPCAGPPSRPASPARAYTRGLRSTGIAGHGCACGNRTRWRVRRN